MNWGLGVLSSFRLGTRKALGISGWVWAYTSRLELH